MPARKVEESRGKNREPGRSRFSSPSASEPRSKRAPPPSSTYLRNLGLGFQPHSTLNQEAILSLLKVNADRRIAEFCDD